MEGTTCSTSAVQKSKRACSMQNNLRCSNWVVLWWFEFIAGSSDESKLKKW